MRLSISLLGFLATFSLVNCDSSDGKGSEACLLPRNIPLALQWACDTDAEHFYREADNYDGPVRFLTSRSRIQPYSWTYQPFCLFGDSIGSSTICVWTDHNFGGGRGISIVADVEDAKTIGTSGPFRNSDYLKESNVPSYTYPPFEQRALPGKGFGLIANTTLHLGNRLFAHTPVFAVQDSRAAELTENDLELLYELGIKRLPEKTRKIYMDLHGHFGGHAISDRLVTNAFDLNDYSAVFPETSRLNHDCRPNAHYYFEKSTFTHYVHIIRTVLPGEELTISYISPYLNHKQREIRIKGQWGFKCDCKLCTSPPMFTKASDERLALIFDLEEELDDLSLNRTASPDIALQLISLYEQERFVTPAAEAYTYAALEYSYIGNKPMAQKYAAKAHELNLIWRGPTNKYSRGMRNLMLEPENHPSWLYSEKPRGDITIHTPNDEKEDEKNEPMVDAE
ncbi:SET domain-containing protein [Aulographum hederae CBS 113979]|uniref:SET domain-containing protein n=1 Tax=Aulographum hederae CBS 113979 TaxID=1176131 RepID=A0A6G1HBE7_9PEZI|nr:SET domain-containing protein [Aulographum hederae CBS 113979]